MSWINILNIVYPVGSIYCSTTNISPASSIGGSWTQIENAALRSGDSVGYTGSDTHAITKQEMPVHNHGVTDEDSNINGASTVYTHKTGGSYSSVNRTVWTGSADAGAALVTINAGGGKQCRLFNVPSTAICGIVLHKLLSLLGGDLEWLGKIF